MKPKTTATTTAAAETGASAAAAPAAATATTTTVSLLYDLAGGSACRRGPCDLHCISPLISV